MKMTPSAVKTLAATHNITVYQPRSLRTDGKYPEEALAAQATLQQLRYAGQCDVMIVVAYGLILPQWVLDMPAAGCVNIHASLLPRWRGAAPIQRAIEAGDTHSGVALMNMDAGLDTGGVYVMETIDISPTMTGAQLHDALADMGARMITQHLPDILGGVLLPIPQSNDGATYAKKLNREDGVLPFDETTQTFVGASALQLANRIRAFDHVLGCTMTWRDVPIKVWAAEAVATALYTLDIPCELDGKVADVLRITQVQKAGGRRIAAADFCKLPH